MHDPVLYIPCDPAEAPRPVHWAPGTEERQAREWVGGYFKALTVEDTFPGYPLVLLSGTEAQQPNVRATRITTGQVELRGNVIAMLSTPDGDEAGFADDELAHLLKIIHASDG